MELLGERFLISTYAVVAASRTARRPDASAAMSFVLLTVRVGPRTVPPTTVPASASYSTNGMIAPRPFGNVGCPLGSVGPIVLLPPAPPAPPAAPPAPPAAPPAPEVPPVPPDAPD